MGNDVVFKMSNSRNKTIDIAKGLLILCVVIGHGTKIQCLSDFVYQFHMPLFFILSGYFLKKQRNIKIFAKKKAVRLLIPYLVYMIIDFIFFDHLHNLNRIIHYMYGGRFINGVYWYMTSLYIALIIIVILLNKLNKKQLVALGIIFGGGAIIESNIIDSISFLIRPGIPFDADVSLLIVSYLIIGYIMKDKIHGLFTKQSYKIDIIAIIVAILLFFEYLLIEMMGWSRQIDMKVVCYKNPISVFIIPVLYGFIIVRISAFINRKYKLLDKILAYIGQVTIPIMFLHEPLNRFCPISINILFYIFIGIGIPIFFSKLISAFEWCEYFGIPQKK